MLLSLPTLLVLIVSYTTIGSYMSLMINPSLDLDDVHSPRSSCGTGSGVYCAIYAAATAGVTNMKCHIKQACSAAACPHVVRNYKVART